MYPDPRPHFPGWAPLSESDINSFRSACIDILEFELVYALGETRAGWAMRKEAAPLEEPVISLVMQDSPAQRAGIRKGDKIVELGGTSIGTISDFNRYFDSVTPKQGETLTVKLMRAGEVRDAEITYPIIPDPSPGSRDSADEKE